MASKQGGASASTDARGAKSTGPSMPTNVQSQKMSASIKHQQNQASGKAEPTILNVLWSDKESDWEFEIPLLFTEVQKYTLQIICTPADFFTLIFMFQNEDINDSLQKMFAEMGYKYPLVRGEVNIGLGSKVSAEPATIRDEIGGAINNVKNIHKIQVFRAKTIISDKSLITKWAEMNPEFQRGNISIYLDKGNIWLVGRNIEALKELGRSLKEQQYIDKEIQDFTENAGNSEDGKPKVRLPTNSENGNMKEMTKERSTGTEFLVTSGQNQGNLFASTYSNNLSGINSGEMSATVYAKGARSKTGENYLVTFNFASKKLRQKDSFPADFLLLRKWSYICLSKKISQIFMRSGFRAAVEPYGNGQLHIEVSNSSEMSDSQFLEWKASFYKAVKMLDIFQVELQSSQNDISFLKKELDSVGNINDTVDVFCAETQPCSLYIQGLLEDIVSILSSRSHLINSMDMIDPETGVKQEYFTLEMFEDAWKLVEYLGSMEKVKQKFKTVHFCRIDKGICGIGEAKIVADVKRFFCDGLYLKGVPCTTLKDFPIPVLEFMKRKLIQKSIDEKVKKHGIWLIGKNNVLSVYSKTENNLKVIAGIIQRFILWKDFPLQWNALSYLGEKLKKMLSDVQKILDTEKFSVDIVGIAHSEHSSALLIFTADIAEEPRFKEFFKDLEENVQYEKKTIELPYHSFLEEICMNDIQEVGNGCHVEVQFSKNPDKIHIEGPMAGVSFVEEYLRTFASNHLIIPVPNLDAIMEKVDDLKKRAHVFVQISKCKMAKMWLTQTMSVMLYCGQPSDEFHRQVSVIPEVTENKELYEKQGNIQWEEVNHSSVHLRFPKWQSGDNKDKHLMNDTIEDMMKQMRTYEKTSVLFPLHEFPTWPIDKLVKSIISSTWNLKGHLKIILMHPDEKKYRTAAETISISLKDSCETAVNIVDVWGQENLLEAISMELDIAFLEEMSKIRRPSETVKQTDLKEPPEQKMSFRDATEMGKSHQEKPFLSDDLKQKEEKGYLVGNEEEKACLVVTFVSRQIDIEKIAKLTRAVHPRAVHPRAIIQPYEKENMALIVFENATDAAKVIEQHKKTAKEEIMLDFLPKQAVVGVHAQISSTFLEKFKDKNGLWKGIETSSGTIVKEIPGEKWLLTGSLPQIQLAHKYLQNELTKMKYTSGHSIQLQGAKKVPPESNTVQTFHDQNTSNLSPRQKTFNTGESESASNGGSACFNQKSNVHDLLIPMEESSYKILLFFSSCWSGKDVCSQITYGNGNLKLSGSKENIEKLKSEIPALLTEINKDILKPQDFVFKDLLKNFESRKQLDVYMMYFENSDSCWLEFAGFSKEQISEVKDSVLKEIEKERKEIESKKIPVAEGGASVNNEEPKNIQTFYTNENLEVKVYKGDITNLNVDCIVSSNTRKLDNDWGVAKAIANAAGPKLKEECRTYILEKGELEKGFCCTTGPGNLPYKYIIHVAGPIWSHGSNPNVASVLKQSIFSILKEAARLRVRSVAIPAISAGQRNANKSICTRIYAEAVCVYSAESTQSNYSSLKEIHFIDREDAIVELIVKGFKEHFEKSAVQTKSNIFASSRTGESPVMGGFKPFCQVRMMKSIQVEEYNLTEFFKVITWKGDILEFPQKYAVCCGQDTDFKSNSNIAKQFKSESDVKKQIADIKKNQKPFQIGNVFQVKSKECMIYYVIIKSYTGRKENEQSFLSDVTLCVKNVLCKAEKSKERAIAVPLLGTGNAGAQKSRAAKAWLEGVIQFLRDTLKNPSHHLHEVYFVSSCEEDVVTMASLFKHRIDTCKNVHGVVYESFL